MIGFVAGGVALHSPGAVALGQYAFEWGPPAALIVAVAVAHALADGAPATWGVSLAAAISGVAAALAFAWAARSWDWRTVAPMSFAWWAGRVGGLAWGAAPSPAMRRILRERRALTSQPLRV